MIGVDQKMPQEFQVISCYKCGTFQVHQVKRVTKWSCKMCGEKQSLKKVFMKGSGAECREAVQNTNMKKGQMSEEMSNKCYEDQDHSSEVDNFDRTNAPKSDSTYSHGLTNHNIQSSKWKRYLYDERQNDENDETFQDSAECQFVLQKPQNKGRKRKLQNEHRPTTTISSNSDNISKNLVTTDDFMGVKKTHSLYNTFSEHDKSDSRCNFPDRTQKIKWTKYDDSLWCRQKASDNKPYCQSVFSRPSDFISDNKPNCELSLPSDKVNQCSINSTSLLSKVIGSSCKSAVQPTNSLDKMKQDMGGSKWGKYLQVEDTEPDEEY